MSPDEALAEIEDRLLPPSPGQRTLSDEIREILARVDSRYWLPRMVDAVVAAYKEQNMTEVLCTIAAIVERNHADA